MGIYRYHQARLNSFVGWTNTHVTPEDLSAAGFYYTGVTDIVRCFACGLQLEEWMAQDNAFESHTKWSRDCEFMMGVSENVSLSDSETLHDPKHSPGTGSSLLRRHERAITPYYEYATARAQSYTNWPPTGPPVLRMAEAGFFHINHLDYVRCFHCNLGLRVWTTEDDPWECHAQWNPNCAYLLAIKGEPYVNQVQLSLNHGFNER